jgi:hypothetical protein
MTEVKSIVIDILPITSRIDEDYKSKQSERLLALDGEEFRKNAEATAFAVKRFKEYALTETECRRALEKHKKAIVDSALKGHFWTFLDISACERDAPNMCYPILNEESHVFSRILLEEFKFQHFIYRKDAEQITNARFHCDKCKYDSESPFFERWSKFFSRVFGYLPWCRHYGYEICI